MTIIIDYKVLADKIEAELHSVAYEIDDSFAKTILDYQKFSITNNMVEALQHDPEYRYKIIEKHRNSAYIKVLDNAIEHLKQLAKIITELNKAATDGTLTEYLKSELLFAEEIVYFAYKNPSSVYIGRTILTQIPVFQADSRLHKYFNLIMDLLIKNGDYELIIKLELLTLGYRAHLESSLSSYHSKLSHQAHLCRQIARDQKNNKALELSHYFDLALYVQEFCVSLHHNKPFTLKHFCGLKNEEKSFLVKLINNIVSYLPRSIGSTSEQSPIQINWLEGGYRIAINNLLTEFFAGYYVNLTEYVDHALLSIINEVAHDKTKLKIANVEDILAPDMYFEKRMDSPIYIADEAFKYEGSVPIGELVLDLISSQPDEMNSYRTSYRADSYFGSLLWSLVRYKKEKYFAKLISFPYEKKSFSKMITSIIYHSNTPSELENYAKEKDYLPICRYLTLHQYILNICAHKSLNRILTEAFPFDDLSQDEVDFINICVIRILRHHPELKISDPREDFRDKLIVRPHVKNTLSDVDQKLVDAILAEDEVGVQQALSQKANVNVAYVRNFSESNRNYHYKLIDKMHKRLFPDGIYFETVYPLHLATEKANLNITKMLLQNGGDPTQKDSLGYSLLRTLTHNKNKEKTPPLISLLVNDSRVEPDNAELIEDLIFEKNPEGLLALIENPKVHWFIFAEKPYSFSCATLEMLIIMLTSANADINYCEDGYYKDAKQAINKLAKTICTQRIRHYPELHLFSDNRKNDSDALKQYLKIRFIVLKLFDPYQSIIGTKLTEEEINGINKEEYRWFIRTLIKHHLALHELSNTDLLVIFDSEANNLKALREVEMKLFSVLLRKDNKISKIDMLSHLTVDDIKLIQTELKQQGPSFCLSLITNASANNYVKITHIFTSAFCSQVIDHIIGQYLQTTNNSDAVRHSQLRHIMERTYTNPSVTDAHKFSEKFAGLFIDLIYIYLSQNSFISSTMPMLNRFINDSDEKKFYKDILLFMATFIMQAKPDNIDLATFIQNCLEETPIVSKESIYMLIKNSNKLSWIQDQLILDFKNEEIRNVFTKVYYQFEVLRAVDVGNNSMNENDTNALNAFNMEESTSGFYLKK